MELNIKLVSVCEIKNGDWIILDDGSERQVKWTGMGSHKDQMAIHLRGTQPVYVNSYWMKFIRKIGFSEPGRPMIPNEKGEG